MALNGLQKSIESIEFVGEQSEDKVLQRRIALPSSFHLRFYLH